MRNPFNIAKCPICGAWNGAGCPLCFIWVDVLGTVYMAIKVKLES